MINRRTKTPLKRTPLSRGKSTLKRTSLNRHGETAKQKAKERKELHAEDIKFYTEIWEERKHNCEISGKYLGDEILTTFFHHLLPKELYPQYRHSKWNILLCSPRIHNQIETNPNLLDDDQYDKFIIQLNKAKKKAGI